MKLTLNPDERILVVSPHPDDESIGCGGLLAKFYGKCDVLLVTDGYDEQLANKELSQKRLDEFFEAVSVCGVDQKYFLHIPEKNVSKNKDKFLKVDFSRYKYIFVPNRNEYHNDHTDTYKMINKVLRIKKVNVDLLEYEIWTTLRKPNVVLDISDVIDIKNKAILKHKSQVSLLDYVGMINGLNRYRGIIARCDYAEAFYCHNEFCREKKRHIKRRLKAFIGK